MTTRASKWVEELVRDWIHKTEDETQLDYWERLIGDRKRRLREARHLTVEQIKDGLRRCERGERLYAEKPIGDAGDTTCFFMQYQPRAKRVWLATTVDAPPKKWRHMTLREAYAVQLARTDIATRKRAPKEAA